MGSASRVASECRLTGDALGANGGTLAEIGSFCAPRVLPLDDGPGGAQSTATDRNVAGEADDSEEH